MNRKSFLQLLVLSPLAAIFRFKRPSIPIHTRWVCIYELGGSHEWCEQMAARFTLDYPGQVERWVKMVADPITNPDDCIGRFETTISMKEWESERACIYKKYTRAQRIMLGTTRLA